LLVEREVSLGLMTAAFAGLPTEGGRVVLVRAPAGGGKTALIDEFVLGVESVAHVMVGRCDDLSIPRPLGPFWDFMHAELGLDAAVRGGDVQDVMVAVRDAMLRRLRPTVVVIDDVQWADDATLDVIRHVGRRVTRLNGLLILAFRESELDSDHPLRLVIGDLSPSSIVQVPLEPLSLEGVAAIAIGSELDSEEVYGLTGGNPLLVTELVRWGGTPSVSIRDLVVARRARLEPDARALVDFVSVLPRGAELAVIDAAVGADDDDLRACERLGLLVYRDGFVSFQHEIVRRIVENNLGATQRRHLNVLALRSLPSGSPSELFHLAVAAGDVDAMLELGPAAARAAFSASSYQGAIDHVRAVMPMIDKLSRQSRAEVLETGARAMLMAGDGDAADMIERAIGIRRVIGTQQDLAADLVLATRILAFDGNPDGARTAIREAIELLETEDPNPHWARALGRSAWLHLLRGEIDQAKREAGVALEVGRSTSDDLAIIRGLNTLGIVALYNGDPYGFRILEECRSTAEIAGLRYEEARVAWNMAANASVLYDSTTTLEYAQRAHETAIRYGIDSFESAAKDLVTSSLMLSGRWPEAESHAIDAVNQTPRTPATAHLQALNVLAMIRVRTGSPEGPATVEELWAKATATELPQHIVPAASIAAEYACLTSDQGPVKNDEMAAAVEAAEQSSLRWVGGELAFWMHLRSPKASVAHGWIAEPYRLMIDGRSEAAAAHFKARQWPYETAIAMIGGRPDAQLEALDILRSLGASGTEAWLASILASQGVAVRRGPATATKEHPLGLTERQDEVLTLLAQDFTNQQIADMLFLSRRTVDSHVSAILMKLRVPDRRTAVDVATEHGLI
jgi:DNA-binding CsgD family transcriptional regulator/tetratricopeptide (TPR) repeat protein